MTFHQQMTSTHHQTSTSSNKSLRTRSSHYLRSSTVDFTPASVSSFDRQNQSSLLHDSTHTNTATKRCNLLKHEEAGKNNETTQDETQIKIRIQPSKQKTKAKNKGKKRDIKLGKRALELGRDDIDSLSLSNTHKHQKTETLQPKRVISKGKNKSLLVSESDKNDEGIKNLMLDQNNGEEFAKNVRSRKQRNIRNLNQKQKKRKSLKRNSLSTISSKRETSIGKLHNVKKNPQIKSDETDHTKAPDSWKERLRSARQTKALITTQTEISQSTKDSEHPTDSERQSILSSQEQKTKTSDLLDNHHISQIVPSHSVDLDLKHHSSVSLEPTLDSIKKSISITAKTTENIILDTTCLTDSSEHFMTWGQKIAETPVGKSHQTKLLAYQLNSRTCQERRAIKEVWNPDSVKEEELLSCFAKIEEIIDQEVSNQEIILKNLCRLDLDVDKLVENVKKNKSYYQNNLCLEHRILRNRKML